MRPPTCQNKTKVGLKEQLRIFVVVAEVCQNKTKVGLKDIPMQGEEEEEQGVRIRLR